MVEEERKFTVEPEWLMPDLSPAAPAGGSLRGLPPATLVATYHDAVDLRLARAGVSLRRREGDELPWTVKLPTGSPGVRHEISRAGAAHAVPAELVEPVTVVHRGARLAPVAMVRTVRHGHEILDRASTVLAEVVDDQVTVLDAEGAGTGGFREVEAKRKAGDVDLLDRLTLADVDEALRSPRYPALVDALVLAARAPRFTPRAELPANRVLPRLVARPWRRLAGTARKPGGVALLDPAGPDEQWHTVRKQGKQARSAVTAVAPVLGGDATKLARALAKVQKLLGEHQDAAVAAQTWRAVAEARPADHELAVTAGRLLERERAAVRRARADFPYAWRRASRRRRTRWLAW
ncbi:CHAD domain-containing protein [Micromonospora sp. LOL_024]|uniref:CYTH and CHAD domain-containing protein n=1 Tax=Micromonospora sp. LOL_024 TaxID=3345412 RepID=UPI003A86C1B4